MKLNVGCGKLQIPGYVNVDWVKLEGVDVVANLDEPWPFEDNSVEEVLASHVFEHVIDPVFFVQETWRVLQPRGRVLIRVPYYRHPNAFTDPTHKRFCTENTFDYWIKDAFLHISYGDGYGSPPVVFRKLAIGVSEDGSELRVALEKI